VIFKIGQGKKPNALNEQNVVNIVSISSLVSVPTKVSGDSPSGSS